MGFMSRTAIIFIVLVVIGFGGLYFLLQTKQTTFTPQIPVVPSPTVQVQRLITIAPSISVTPSSTSAVPTINPVAAKKATIKTSKGDIVFSFYGKEAPGTVANFVQKAQSGFYNNLTFHRVEDWVIQGGDPKGNGTGGGDLPTELSEKPFVVGSVGVARGGDIKISNDSQFFITKTEAPWLNNQYTNFGIVTDGMNVVNTIKIGDRILGISIE